jgi:hypothetical protein
MRAVEGSGSRSLFDFSLFSSMFRFDTNLPTTRLHHYLPARLKVFPDAVFASFSCSWCDRLRIWSQP